MPPQADLILPAAANAAARRRSCSWSPGEEPPLKAARRLVITNETAHMADSGHRRCRWRRRTGFALGFCPKDAGLAEQPLPAGSFETLVDA